MVLLNLTSLDASGNLHIRESNALVVFSIQTFVFFVVLFPQTSVNKHCFFCRIMYRELKDSDKERESGKMVITRF